MPPEITELLTNMSIFAVVATCGGGLLSIALTVGIIVFVRRMINKTVGPSRGILENGIPAKAKISRSAQQVWPHVQAVFIGEFADVAPDDEQNCQRAQTIQRRDFAQRAAGGHQSFAERPEGTSSEISDLRSEIPRRVMLPTTPRLGRLAPGFRPQGPAPSQHRDPRHLHAAATRGCLPGEARPAQGGRGSRISRVPQPGAAGGRARGRPGP